MLDTIKTLEAIGVEVAVIRHSEKRYYDDLQDAKLSIINAGDGAGSHPTQALLDALTIIQEFGKIEGLKIGIVGDVKHSRVANSDAGLFRRLGAKVYFSGPEFWFDEGMLVNGTYMQFDDLVKEVDVLMLLRIQHERHERTFNFKSEDSFGTEVIKGGDFSFFDAAGDEGAGTACGGEVNSRTALHGLNDVRGTETFSNHAGKTAGVNETGGVGIHASAGGGTCGPCCRGAAGSTQSAVGSADPRHRHRRDIGVALWPRYRRRAGDGRHRPAGDAV